MSSPAQPMILAPDGKPFTSEKLANEFIKKQELDPTLFEAFKHQGGWCVFNLSVLPNGMKEMLKAASEKPSEPVAAAPASKEVHRSAKYFRVIFQAKTNPNDLDKPELGVNGATLIVEREVEVIVPGSYLEAADHTVKNQYEQKPGHDRKIVGKVRTYMYQVISEATKAEFEAYKKSGNATRDKEIAAREHANR